MPGLAGVISHVLLFSAEKLYNTCFPLSKSLTEDWLLGIDDDGVATASVFGSLGRTGPLSGTGVLAVKGLCDLAVDCVELTVLVVDEVCGKNRGLSCSAVSCAGAAVVLAVALA